MLMLFFVNNYLGFLLSSTEISFSSLFADVMFIVVQAGVFVIIIYAGFKRFKKTLGEVFKVKPVSISIWITMIICSIGFVLLSFYLHYFIYDLFQVPSYSEETYQNYITTVISIALIPAVAEEMFFKGVILTALRRHYSLTLASVITSLLFAACHLSIYRGLPLFIVEYFTIWIYVQSGSILLPMFIHFLNNFFALFLIDDPFSSPITFLAAQVLFWVCFLHLQWQFTRLRKNGAKPLGKNT
jgi:membrane protease YdiL (CAAX protease family)